MVTIKDIAWTSGFIEGEGSFGGSHNGKSGSMITAWQVQKQPLEKLLELYGGSISFRHPSQRTSIWQWCLYGNKSIGLMMTIYSLMSSKRKEQIKRIILYWKNRQERNWRSKLTHCKQGHEFNEQNTRIGMSYNGNPKRHCRACINIRSKRYKETKVLHGAGAVILLMLGYLGLK